MTISAPETAVRTVELTVSGMTCAACSARVERTLNKLDGVRASVNYATERATVQVPDELADDVLVERVRKAGYTAEIRGEEDPGTGFARVRDLRRRLVVAALLAIPLGNLSITLALVPRLRFPGWELLCLVLAVPVVFWSALPFHRATLRNLRHRSSSMDTLVSIGVLASFAWSAWSAFSGGTGPGYWIGFGPTAAGADAIYLDVAAGVTTFLLAGRYFESRSRRSAAGLLAALEAMAAKDVRVSRDGVELMVPIGELAVGDLFVVKPGESIAADGVVDSGLSTVDVSAVTGEPVPAEVGAGDRVIGASVNRDGRLVIRATAVGAHTQLAQMTALAERAQARKAAVQRLVDRICAVFVPAVLGVAALTLAGWLVTGAPARDGFAAAVAVLIIACPCALGLATPTALMAGVGRGAQLGILIKGPDALEASRSVDTVVLDKTRHRHHREDDRDRLPPGRRVHRAGSAPVRRGGGGRIGARHRHRRRDGGAGRAARVAAGRRLLRAARARGTGRGRRARSPRRQQAAAGGSGDCRPGRRRGRTGRGRKRRRDGDPRRGGRPCRRVPGDPGRRQAVGAGRGRRPARPRPADRPAHR